MFLQVETGNEPARSTFVGGIIAARCLSACACVWWAGNPAVLIVVMVAMVRVSFYSYINSEPSGMLHGE